jgi:hypothetical protein
MDDNDMNDGVDQDNGDMQDEVCHSFTVHIKLIAYACVRLGRYAAKQYFDAIIAPAAV